MKCIIVRFVCVIVLILFRRKSRSLQDRGGVSFSPTEYTANSLHSLFNLHLFCFFVFFLQTVIEVLKPEKVKAGVWVIREGDDGDNFFIVNSGTFNIYKKEDKKDKGNGKLISTLKGEGSFGELALLLVLLASILSVSMIV